MYHFNHILFVNKSNNKIIYPSCPNSIIIGDGNCIKDNIINIKRNKKVSLLLSDDFKIATDYTFMFNIASNENNVQTNLTININQDQKKIIKLNLTKNFQQIKLSVSCQKQVVKSHHQSNLIIPDLNVLNIESNIHVKLTNLFLDESAILNKISSLGHLDRVDSLKKIVLYVHHYNNSYSSSAGTYSQQAQKIRSLLLKNINIIKNFIIEVFSVHDVDNTHTFNDDSYLICNEIVGRARDNDKQIISEFCKKIGKNRFYCGYESPIRDVYSWMINYINEYFDYCFTNYSTIADNNKYFWLPAYHRFFFDYDFKVDINVPHTVKTDFLSNNPIASFHAERNNMIKKIGKLCNFTFFGKEKELCNVFKDRLIRDNVPNNLTFKSMSKLDILSKFKFILVCENSSLNGYFTEKFIDCFLCGSVMIYFGPPDCRNIFPELFVDCVINGWDYSIDKLVALITNMSDADYKLRVNKMKGYNKLLLDLFAEYSQTTLVLHKILSNYNIDIPLSNGMLELITINKRLALLNKKI